mmetsp:Transcript_5088/g.16615  ORF Transcript_5088/g.16615 Transcript_5088/m.16615 type:complete len:139 (-) Transcript_5088:1483-1899(-)
MHESGHEDAFALLLMVLLGKGGGNSEASGPCEVREALGQFLKHSEAERPVQNRKEHPELERDPVCSAFGPAPGFPTAPMPPKWPAVRAETHDNVTVPYVQQGNPNRAAIEQGIKLDMCARSETQPYWQPWPSGGALRT